METYTQIAEHLGIPFACLVALAAAIWVWTNRLAAFMAPRVDKVVDATVANTANLQALGLSSEANHQTLYAVVMDIKAKCEAILMTLKGEDA